MSLHESQGGDKPRRRPAGRATGGSFAGALPGSSIAALTDAEPDFLGDLFPQNASRDELRAGLERYARQQLLLDRATGLALNSSSEEIANAVVVALRQGLRVNSACLLELAADEVEFIVRAHVGPRPCSRSGSTAEPTRDSSGDESKGDGPVIDEPSSHEPRSDEIRCAQDDRIAAIGQSAAGWALRHSQVILVDDYDAQDRFEREPWREQAHIRSAINVRVPGQKRPYGVLVAQSSAPGHFSRADAAFIRALANIVSESIARELTERHRGRMYEELHRAMSAREEVLSIISHDLRSPATTIKLSLEVVRRALADPGAPISPDQVQRAVLKANASLERMMKMMDDLLAMNRAEGDAFDIVWQKVDLREVIDDVLGELTGAIEASGSPVSLEGPASLVGLWDRVRVEQIVANLISNAIKYGRGGPIRLQLSQCGPMARFTVRDAGPGIAPEEQKRIFERFVRIDSRNEPPNIPKQEGYGLGLWIVKRIVEALGGSISVESRAGQGSSFTVELPLARPTLH
jgi:signal transduction histidine kinase